METNGIELDGAGLVFPVILGNKGDWSYLATCTLEQVMYVFNMLMLFHRITLCVLFLFHSFPNPVQLCTLSLHFEVSSANLERSYRRAPKHAKNAAGDVGVEGAGICHLCTVGMGTDWENLCL